jgi:hypothetical protein
MMSDNSSMAGSNPLLNHSATMTDVTKIMLTLARTLFLLVLLFSPGSSNEVSSSQQEASWQDCDIFLAPSSSMGWGVFAARDFKTGEIVEVAPLFLPMDQNDPVIHESILDDYIYGYGRFTYGVEEMQVMDAVVVGMTMFYNHHTEKNVGFTVMSIEPDQDHPDASNALGFLAKRDIQAGEELFSSYGDDDGGEIWFSARRIDMKVPEVSETRISQDNLPQKMEAYCSNIYAGVGRETWEEKVVAFAYQHERGAFPHYDISRFAPRDAGLGNAIARRAVSKSERIEIAPGIVMSRSSVNGTLLAPLVFGWEALTQENRQALSKLRENGRLTLQFQSQDTEWQRIDRFESFEDIAILPVAGNIGMLQRVGSDGGSNCRLVIRSDDAEGTVGVTLEVIATEDIEVGDVLKLDLRVPPTGSRKVVGAFRKEMSLTGQRYQVLVGLDSQDQNDEL